MWYHGDVTEPLVAAKRADAQRLIKHPMRHRTVRPTFSAHTWTVKVEQARALALQALVR